MSREHEQYLEDQMMSEGPLDDPDQDHTPGPWFWKNGSLQNEREYVVTADIDLTDGHKPICVVDNPANARLAAAAPDLFEALDQLLDDMGADGLFVCQAAKDQAKTALAKARGETPG